MVSRTAPSSDVADGEAAAELEAPTRRPSPGLLALAALVAGASGWALYLAPGEPAHRTFFLEVLAATGQPEASLLDALRRGLAAPWFHGDLGHLAGNLVGLLLLGTLTGPGALRVVLAGALAGTAAQTAAGQATLGLSGGVYALAGCLVRGQAGATARWIGAVYLGLGFLGGLGSPQSDVLAHGLGAALGIVVGPDLLGLTRARTLPMLLLWVIAPTATLLLREQAIVASKRAAPMLDALPRWRELVRLGVEAQATRHAAVGALLERARKDEPWTDEARELVRVLPPAPEEQRRASALDPAHLPGLPEGSEYRPRLRGLLPLEPPPAFRELPLPPPSEESAKTWEGLLEHLGRRDRALEGGAEALYELRRELRRTR